MTEFEEKGHEKKIDLLEGSIAGTLARLAFPIMGTSFIQMGYNLVDMIWIGRLGSNAVAAVGAAGGVLADQWKEYFYCEAMPADVLVTKAHKKVSGRSSNKHGSENYHIQRDL